MALLVFVLAAGLLSACGSDPEAAEGRERFEPMPKPPSPIDLPIPLLSGPVIEAICVAVEVVSEHTTADLTTSVSDALVLALTALGIDATPVNGPGDCDTALDVTLRAEGLNAVYGGRGLCFTGQGVEGEMRLSGLPGEDLIAEIEAETHLRGSITDRTACGAANALSPFHVWTDAVADALASWWGEGAVVGLMFGVDADRGLVGAIDTDSPVNDWDLLDRSPGVEILASTLMHQDEALRAVAAYRVSQGANGPPQQAVVAPAAAWAGLRLRDSLDKYGQPIADLLDDAARKLRYASCNDWHGAQCDEGVWEAWKKLDVDPYALLNWWYDQQEPGTVTWLVPNDAN